MQQWHAEKQKYFAAVAMYQNHTQAQNFNYPTNLLHTVPKKFFCAFSQCVCARARARGVFVCARVRVRVRVRVFVCVCMIVCVCV